MNKVIIALIAITMIFIAGCENSQVNQATSTVATTVQTSVSTVPKTSVSTSVMTTIRSSGSSGGDSGGNTEETTSVGTTSVSASSSVASTVTTSTSGTSTYLGYVQIDNNNKVYVIETFENYVWQFSFYGNSEFLRLFQTEAARALVAINGSGSAFIYMNQPQNWDLDDDQTIDFATTLLATNVSGNKATIKLESLK